MAKSVDVSTTITLIVGLGLLIGGGGLLIQYLREMMANSFSQVGRASSSLTTQQVSSVFTTGLCSGSDLAAQLRWPCSSPRPRRSASPSPTTPSPSNFEKLNPLSGLKNLFSLTKLTQTGQNLIKLGVVTAFAYLAINDIRGSAVFSRPVSLAELGNAYVAVAWSLGWRIVTVLVVLAVPTSPGNAGSSTGTTA